MQLIYSKRKQINRLSIWKRAKGQEGNTKEHEERFESNEYYVHYLDCGNGFMCLQIKLYFKYMPFIISITPPL